MIKPLNLRQFSLLFTCGLLVLSLQSKAGGAEAKTLLDAVHRFDEISNALSLDRPEVLIPNPATRPWNQNNITLVMAWPGSLP